jgi:hypothetical protein
VKRSKRFVVRSMMFVACIMLTGCSDVLREGFTGGLSSGISQVIESLITDAGEAAFGGP